MIHLHSLKYLFPIILLFALPEGISAQSNPEKPHTVSPENGIIVRWSRRDPFTVYAGHIGWTVVIETRMRNSFRATGKPGPNTIIVRDSKGRPVPPSPVQPVYTLKSGNIHSDFLNSSFCAFTLIDLGFYLAPGRYSIEVIHCNDQDPPRSSSHSFPPFKGRLVSPPFEFEALPHADPGWSKPVFDLELTISSLTHKVAVGDPITLQATIHNTGNEPRTLPGTHWNYLARAYLDDPNGGRFREQKRGDVVDMEWTRKPRILQPGQSHSFNYSTEIFDFGNKHIGRKCQVMNVYLEAPGSKTGAGETTVLYSNKTPVMIYRPTRMPIIHRPAQVWVWGFGLAVVALSTGTWILFRLRRKKRKSRAAEP